MKNTHSQIICGQLDPMPYAHEARRVVKIYYKEQNEKEVDRKQAEVNAKSMNRGMDNMLHPNHGKLSCIDMSLVGLLFNSENRISTVTPFDRIFNQNFINVIIRNHRGEASNADLKILETNRKICQPIFEYSLKKFISRRNISPYYGMDEVFKAALNNFVDFCFWDYPEPTHRLFLSKFSKMTHTNALELFDAVIRAGRMFNKASLELGM